MAQIDDGGGEGRAKTVDLNLVPNHRLDVGLHYLSC